MKVGDKFWVWKYIVEGISGTRFHAQYVAVQVDLDIETVVGRCESTQEYEMFELQDCHWEDLL